MHGGLVYTMWLSILKLYTLSTKHAMCLKRTLLRFFFFGQENYLRWAGKSLTHQTIFTSYRTILEMCNEFSSVF